MFHPQGRHKVSKIAILFLLTLCPVMAFGQTQPTTEGRGLLPNQSLEREMMGAETHRYRFDLKLNEFFQVRVEQKGVDVALRLLDATGNVLATMDSPNGKQGPETLSFVAATQGSYALEVRNSDTKAEKSAYTIRRVIPGEATAKDKRRVAVELVFVEGVTALKTAGQAEVSIRKLEEALAGWQELADSEMAKLTAQYVDFQKMNQMLMGGHTLVQQANDLRTEGIKKSSIELLHSAKDKVFEANDKFLQAGVLAQNLISDYPEFVTKTPALKDFPYYAQAGKINAASFLANYFNYLLEPQDQLKFARLAVSLAGELRTLETPGIHEDIKVMTEANAILGLAIALAETKNTDAINYYEQFLSLYRELQKLGVSYYDKRREADYLGIIANSYFNQELCKDSFSICQQKAIEYAEKAISQYDSPGDKEKVANFYGVISTSYFKLHKIYKAFEYSNKALSLSQSLDNKQAVALALVGKAKLYVWLGNKEKSQELIKQGLDVLLSIPDYIKSIDSSSITPFDKRNRLRTEYGRRSAIAGFYAQIGDRVKSLDYFQETIPIARLLDDKITEANSLSVNGYAYREMNDWKNALAYNQQACSLYQETGDRRNQASELVSIGMDYLGMANPQEALQSLNQAQLIFTALGVDDGGVTNNLARAWYALGNRRLAIFYGTRFVDWIQRERLTLSDFDKATQQGFVNSFEKPVRRLADWLIEEGRFAQAEQVLRMLKEEEYSDFVRRDADEIKNLNQRVTSDGREKELIERYTRLADRVTQIGQEYFKLDEKQRQLSHKQLKLSDDEATRFKELSMQLETANGAFKLFLDKVLVTELGEEKAKKIEIDRSLQDKLKGWGRGTVLLYTVVGEDRYRVFLTTPTVQVDGKYEIKAADLNKKVFAFRDALQNPKVDPRPLGKELYDILIKPIEKDLQAAGAQTLVWSLDGTLRYIPLAALSADGKSYLVEQYRNVIITPTTRQNLSSTITDWRALGLGVSQPEAVTDPDDPEKKKRIDFGGLPGTKVELSKIVRNEHAQNETGVLIGKRFLDEKFTAQTLIDALAEETKGGKAKYTVIHFASHFRLGNKWSNSFLLLGNGQILTLEEIGNSPNIRFGNVEIVTLSACNTAFADETNGKEVDSLAEVIQTKGGKAILATLWSVADESTSLLMSEFYRLRNKGPNLTKAEAMQLAQRAMLRGRYKARETPLWRGPVVAGTMNSQLPPFKRDDNAPYAHPYFWSPFVLIGNWK